VHLAALLPRLLPSASDRENQVAEVAESSRRRVATIDATDSLPARSQTHAIGHFQSLANVSFADVEL
jgi:hypothetical protein